MHKILLIAKRDYLASVRSKAFLFGLVFAPLLFGGVFIALAFQRGNVDVDRRIAILDQTGIAAPAVVQAIEERNRKDMFDATTGRKIMQRVVIETVAAEKGKLDEQRIALSDRLRRRELFAFIEIGPEALDPTTAGKAKISFYTNAGAADNFQNWVAEPLNEGLRRVRLVAAGIDSSRLTGMLNAVPVQSMTLVARDAKTGEITKPVKKDLGASFGVPYVMVMLLMMIVLFGSVTILPGVAEDKLQRVFEMLLVSATPFELMAGKVLAAVGRSLTSSVFYIAGGVLALQGLALIGLVPFVLLPWFFIYVVAEVAVLSSLGVALGAACGSPQDAQHLNQILILPLIIPIVLLAPMLQQPNGVMANVLSLFPPFTPVLMLMRQATPGASVPVWEPWAGLAGILICATLVTWAASRIFRVAILFQGAAPKLPELMQWAVRG
jgi:ABC-2 type transport system permease protein